MPQNKYSHLTRLQQFWPKYRSKRHVRCSWIEPPCWQWFILLRSYRGVLKLVIIFSVFFFFMRAHHFSSFFLAKLWVFFQEHSTSRSRLASRNNCYGYDFFRKRITVVRYSWLQFAPLFGNIYCYIQRTIVGNSEWTFRGNLGDWSRTSK